MVAKQNSSKIHGFRGERPWTSPQTSTSLHGGRIRRSKKVWKVASGPKA
uniref:Uncharacterized protein n=1 Tax=Arundo donax TaxID=35708 RepID=A0A0A8YZX3_ARUDO